MISVIIPTLNDARRLPRALAPLVDGVATGLVKQAIVADGGSRDETLDIADAAGCDIVASEPGLGKRMRAGAYGAKGKWLLFLHAGTALSAGWTEETERFISAPQARQRAAAFKFTYDAPTSRARRAAFWKQLRASVMKLPGGAQGMLISRHLYDGVGGYPTEARGEDIAFARRIGGDRITLLETQALVSAEALDQRWAMRASSGV